MKLFKVLQTSFENFDSTIKSYINKALNISGNPTSYSQIFNTVFEGVKGAIQNAIFYIEDALTEQNVETAYRKSSLYSLAKLSGYDPYYGSSATGVLRMSVAFNALTQNNSSSVYIKNGSVLVNSKTGKEYTIYIPNDYISINSNEQHKYYDFKVVQGNWITNTYIAKGEPLETINISTRSMYDASYIEVYVDGEKYNIASCLYDMTPDGNECLVTAGFDNELEVMFGDNNHGKKLSEGQSIIVKYIKHDGISGNVSKISEYDFKFASPVYSDTGLDIDANKFITIVMKTNISGGNDCDSLENIRKMIGYNSRSLVLASENNFKLFLNRFSFIGNSTIWVEPNSLSVNIVCTQNFKNLIDNPLDYFNISKDNKLLLSDENKSMVIDSLNNSGKLFGGSSIKFIDPIIYKYAINIVIKVKKEINRDIIKNNIKTTIANYFIELSDKPNNGFIPKSDLIKYILDNNSDIDYIDFSFVCENKEIAKKKGTFKKYIRKNINGSWKYILTDIQYDSAENVGIDRYGNILVESNFEIPVLSNAVVYYFDDNRYTMDAVNIYFI